MPNENSSPNSPAPQNITYFSDGNILRDMGRVEARLDAHDREFKECKDDLKIVKDSSTFLLSPESPDSSRL